MGQNAYRRFYEHFLLNMRFASNCKVATKRLCTPGQNSSSNADEMLPPSVTFALAAVDLGVKESFQRQDESGFIGVVSREILELLPIN